jgi:hypothetical protein
MTAATAVRCLACDVAHDATMTVRVDFNDHSRPETLVDQRQQGPVHSGVYRATWLRLAGQFVDRTRFDFQADVRCKQKRRTRRKGDRIKRDVWEQFCLTLKVRELSRAAGLTWAEHIRKMRPPGSLSLRSAEGVEGQLVVEFETRHINRQFIANPFARGDDESQLADHRALLFPFLAAYDALGRTLQPA